MLWLKRVDCELLASLAVRCSLYSMASSCLKYGQEEAAKHPVPDGKYVKVACVHKSVPRIME
jgi:hypothetical protein